MKSSPPIGHKAELRRHVDDAQSISLGGRAVVFSTPAMIELMEYAARDAMVPFLEADEETVGVDVQVKHTSATPLGADVWAEATVTQVDGRVIDFDVTAYDSSGKIGHGTHRRAVVNVDRLVAKLEKRPAKHTTSTDPPRNQETLRLVIEGAVAKLTLDRPNKKNAISAQMTAEMEAVTDWLAATRNIRVVVVSGNGGVFSAGDDVSEIDVNDVAAMQNLSMRRAWLYDRWLRLPQILIAQIDGLALGGGFVCTISCDFRIATHNAQLGLPEINLGWPPNYGIGRLLSLVGSSKALELMTTLQRLSASQAFDLGILQRVVPGTQLQASVAELVSTLLQLPGNALSEAKAIVNDIDRSVDRKAGDMFARCLADANASEGITAFREKRKPRFD